MKNTDLNSSWQSNIVIKIEKNQNMHQMIKKIIRFINATKWKMICIMKLLQDEPLSSVWNASIFYPI